MMHINRLPPQRYFGVRETSVIEQVIDHLCFHLDVRPDHLDVGPL